MELLDRAAELIADYLTEEEDTIVPSYDAERIVEILVEHGILQ